MSDQIEEIKLKTDIVGIVGEHVDLKKSGKNFKGLCPFHSEKTPSFMVSPELQIYKCFGCSESGDVFTFLEKYEGMEFGESLKYLAERAGVKLEPLKGVQSDRDKFFEIADLVARFYSYVLLKHPLGKRALDYLLKDRGLSVKTIQEFRIGFSPESVVPLKSFILDKKGISISDLEKIGVTVGGQRLADRFRSRVVFALSDHRGRTIGFSGRIIPGIGRDDVAKYINSPETILYHKSQVLYGLNVARGAIKKARSAVIVEGELDMISCWQAGVKNVVAIKGSALTEEQARLISRFTDKVVIALDADFAGDLAARRGIQIAEATGLEVWVATLTPYKDPDDMARNDPEALVKRFANPVSVWDFVIDSIFSRYDAATTSGKAKISKEVSPVLASISDSIVKAHFVSTVAKRLGVPVEAVAREIDKRKAQISAKPEIVTIRKPIEKSRRERLEERLLHCAFSSKPELLVDPRVSEIAAEPMTQRMLKELKAYLGLHKKFDPAGFAAYLPSELSRGFTDIILKEIDGLAATEHGEYIKEFDEIVNELEILKIKSKLGKLSEEIVELEKSDNDKALSQKEEEFSELTQKLFKLQSREARGQALIRG